MSKMFKCDWIKFEKTLEKKKGKSNFADQETESPSDRAD